MQEAAFTIGTTTKPHLSSRMGEKQDISCQLELCQCPVKLYFLRSLPRGQQTCRRPLAGMVMLGFDFDRWDTPGFSAIRLCILVDRVDLRLRSQHDV
jgi:hypothetical protein